MAKNSKQKKSRITITTNGPYLVFGRLPLAKEIIVTDSNGIPIKWRKGKPYAVQENYALCRCGQSKNEPYCDGAHVKTGFIGTETASRENYLKQAGEISGPDLVLTDAESLCAIARFCDRAGGVWGLTENSDDPKSKKIAIQEAGDCPTGRLVAWDKKTGKPIEPDLKPSVTLVEDPDQRVSGPIWVNGNVPIVASDGKPYEIRNRVTLCRCGESKNKPFCDGSHISSGFTDGDESLE